ncbi:2-hydroxychromene-2-carboxylate isomerase [Pseudomonas stutzeri]|uniref:2-hydroxychromene-2-carboxylate isomerase n=1 Tax=Stutzerimonas stutzeri TaxID=316 RepID=UPI00210C8954|nr:2-hydroxychromene-2-carboxylate isomerase [Stutzerimonas stutzeri]MCQ4313020.1 2-hydroxychromene-2-carboxylate isomerase [Stutzerimonas stutzeri]
MNKTVEFFFDLGSPATYLAWTQLPALCERTGAQLHYRPMLLGGVFQATGNTSPATVPAKGRYMLADLQRHARRYGVPFVFNQHFPINTLSLMRGAMGYLAIQPDAFPRYLDAMFRALWIENRNLADPAVIAEVLQQAGLNPEQFEAMLQNGEIKTMLKANTDEAVQRGVFGAPSFFVDGELFFGQDRLEFVRAALGEA